MKSFVLTAVLLAAGFAQARTVTCTQTAQNIKEQEAYWGDVSVEIPANSAKQIQVKVKEEDGTIKTYTGTFDNHDSEAGLSEDNSYNLDEDYAPKTEARYVFSESELTGSDGDAIIFIEKSVFTGKQGKLSMSSGQANDSDYGTPWVWARNYEFSCK